MSKNTFHNSQREAYFKFQRSAPQSGIKPKKNRSQQGEYIFFDSSSFNPPKYDLSKNHKIGPQPMPLNKIAPNFSQSFHTPIIKV